MKIINILLVDDDHVDALDIQRNLDKSMIVYKMKTAKNGEEGIRILEDADGTDINPFPDIILIDINMPRMNGLEFLKIIRNTNKWQHLKCFIITTSEEHVDKK